MILPFEKQNIHLNTPQNNLGKFILFNIFYFSFLKKKKKFFFKKILKKWYFFEKYLKKLH